MKPNLKILLLERSPKEAATIQRVLGQDKLCFDFKVAMDRKIYLQELEMFQPDLILATNSIPKFNATNALDILHQKELYVPFLFLYDSVNEDFFVKCGSKQANELIFKTSLKQLPGTIQEAIGQQKSEYRNKNGHPPYLPFGDMYRTLVEEAFDPIVLSTVNNTILDCNHAACQFLGYRSGELKGQPIDTIYFITDDDPPDPVKLSRATGLLATRKLKRKDGSAIDMEISTKLLSNGIYMSLARNITDRKITVDEPIQASTKKNKNATYADENLKTFFANTSDGFVLIDSDCLIQTFNEMARETAMLTGGTRLAIGANLREIIPASRKEFFSDIVSRVLKGETVQYDFSYFKEPGQQTWLTNTMNPVRTNNMIQGICITIRNITGRKLAEQQQELDRNNLNALINNTHDLMWSVSRDFRLIASNHAFNTMIKSMSGKIMKPGTHVLSDDFEDQQNLRFKKNYERAFQGEYFTDIEYSNIKYELWSEIVYSPIYEGDLVVGAACFSRDITSRKKAEEEIRQSNMLFEMATKVTNDVIWDWDLLNDKVWWNKNYYASFGYKKNKTSPGSLQSWQAHIHPEDKIRVLRVFQLCIIKKHPFWNEEYRFLKADGSIAFVQSCGYIMYSKSGEPFRMVGGMIDITERKTAEESLRENLRDKQALAERMSAILNTIPASIAVLDAKGVIVSVNSAWRGFADDNNFTGKQYGIGDNYVSISKNSGERGTKEGSIAAKGISKVLKNKTSEFIFEYPCHSDTTRRWFRMIVTPLNKQKPEGVVVMHIDISEIRILEQQRLASKIEEQRKISSAMLQAQVEERSHLGRELHNNISQLLAVVKLKLGICIANYPAGESIARQCMDHITEAMTETRHLSHRLVIPKFTRTSFETALRKIIANYSFAKRKVMLDASRLEEKLVPSDIKEVLYRVVQEQLNNIEKHANASRVEVRLSSSADIVSLYIADNGIGFDTKKKNPGIGLANIMKRAKSCGGWAKIDSEPGKGCKIWVEIPLKQNDTT